MRRFWECKYGYLALAISAGDIVLVCAGLPLIYAMGLWGQAPPWVGRLYHAACLGIPVALVLAIVGLARDSWRLYAGLALILSLVDAVVYGLFFAV